MQTTLKELPDSRVEVQAEVPPKDVERAANRTARAMARELRLPGFRKGKAPPNLVIQRMGFPAVLSEAVRDALPEWYEAALLDAGGDADRRSGHRARLDPGGRGRAAELQVRRRRAAGGRARRVQGARGRQGGQRGRRGGRRHRGRPDPRGLRAPRAGRARRQRGRRGADRLRGLRRRPGLPGRQGRRLPADARLGLADRQLRGPADRRLRPATRSTSRSPSPTSTRKRNWRARTRSSK